MKTKIFLTLLLVQFSNLYGFDYNLFDFCVSHSTGEYIVAIDDKVYLIDWIDVEPTLLEVIDRPDKIINEHGYACIEFESHKFFLVDLNGEILVSSPSDFIRKDYSGLYGQTQIIDVNVSSELIENTDQEQIIYKGIFPLFRLSYDMKAGHFLLYNGIPWVPDMSIDHAPYINITLEEPVNAMSIIPGFLDFKRQHLFYQNSRVKNIEIIDLEENRSLGVFVIKDDISYTTIQFEKPLRKIKVKLLDYFEGTKYTDVCISSIIFLNANKGDYGLSVIQRLMEKSIFEF